MIILKRQLIIGEGQNSNATSPTAEETIDPAVNAITATANPETGDTEKASASKSKKSKQKNSSDIPIKIIMGIFAIVFFTFIIFRVLLIEGVIFRVDKTT